MTNDVHPFPAKHVPRAGRIAPGFRDMGLTPTVRAALAAAGALAGLALVGVFVGFLVFINTLSRLETEFGRKVDGVVALTGGADRIDDALAVLNEQRAQRLLITGVGEKTPVADLVRASGHGALFACCVDIDRNALNTVGNARETAEWARRNGYRSLMVVTSNYHMPRAMVELRRHVKDIELVPHPVIAESIAPHNWWSQPSLGRLLFGEYVKYVASELRSRLAPDSKGFPYRA